MAEAFSCPARAAGCGGCPLLQLPYPEQLRRKQKLAEELLAGFCPVRPILGMERPLHYRNKAIASFAPGPKGRPVCGIYAAGSHRVIPCPDCLLQDERLNRAAAAVQQAAAACRLPAYDEDRQTGLLRHQLLRRGAATGEISVTLVTPSPCFPGSRRFVQQLRSACPDIATVVQNINPRRTSAVLGQREKLLFGRGYIRDTLCKKTFCIPTQAFYQVNPAMTEALYQTALAFAGLTGKERVIDAYCGVGTIGLCAAEGAGELLGIELNREAVQFARINAAQNGVKNARFACADAGRMMEELHRQGQKADLVFLDPPREGASRAFLQALCALAPARAVYISCNPHTLARDLAFLTRRGYHALCAQPVDMFPHTEHVECVVALSRR